MPWVHAGCDDLEAAIAQYPRTMPAHLCCQLSCNFNSRGGVKVRYEGMGLGSLPPSYTQAQRQGMAALSVYRCGASPNSTDLTFGPQDWKPSAAEGGPCLQVKLTNTDFAVVAVAMYVSKTAQKDLVALELYFKKFEDSGSPSDGAISDPTPGDHYAVASAQGKAEAEADGYRKLSTLGWVRACACVCVDPHMTVIHTHTHT